jgi:hypothetical protein
VLFVIADLSKITIDYIKQGNIFHLSVNSIICYCQIIINKMNNILSFNISVNKLIAQYNTIIILDILLSTIFYLYG